MQELSGFGVPEMNGPGLVVVVRLPGGQDLAVGRPGEPGSLVLLLLQGERAQHLVRVGVPEGHRVLPRLEGQNLVVRRPDPMAQAGPLAEDGARTGVPETIRV